MLPTKRPHTSQNLRALWKNGLDALIGILSVEGYRVGTTVFGLYRRFPCLLQQQACQSGESPIKIGNSLKSRGDREERRMDGEVGVSASVCEGYLKSHRCEAESRGTHRN
jgi:hypothetical protein